MSVRTMARVWADSQHSGTHLLMLLAIADFADDDGNAYPAVGTLAEKCRMSARNVNFILSDLRASGELAVRQNEGPRGTNRYCIQHRDAIQTLKQPSSLKPTSPLNLASPPEASFTLKPTSATPEAGFPKPLKPTSDEPSLNHHEPSAKARKRAGDGAGFKLPEGVPADAWADFVEMRKAMRKPMTVKAKTLVILKLIKLRENGQDVRAVLEQSVANSWPDVYAVKAEQRVNQRSALPCEENFI